jgi:hypothetical protein
MEGNRSVSNKELGFKGVVLLHVVHSTIKWQDLVNTERNIPILVKYKEFCNYLTTTSSRTMDDGIR